MGMCKSCGVVYSALIMKDGYCKDCKPELFTDKELNEIEKDGMIGIIDNTPKMSEEELNKKREQENNTCGIVSFVLSILSLFTGLLGIIFAIISLTCGIKSSENILSKVGIVISGIYITLLILSVLGVVSILGSH